MFTVYVIYNRKWQRYYVGSTNNYIERMARHNSGRSRYTRGGIPWELIYSIECETRPEAYRLEQKIKKRGIRRFLDDNNIRGVAQSG